MKKLNYLRVIWTLLFAILLASSSYSAYLYFLKPTMLIPWFNSVIATILSASFAILIAIYVYWSQRRDDINDKKSILIEYLNYLINNLPDSSNENTRVSIGYVNTSIINTIINTGYFNEISFSLVKLQAKIEYYVLFSGQIIRIQIKENKAVQPFQKQNIENSKNHIILEANNCLDGLRKHYK